MKKKTWIKAIGAITFASATAALAYQVNVISKKMKAYKQVFIFKGHQHFFTGEFSEDSYGVSFSGLQLDFTNATLKDNKATLDIYGHVSGIDIVIPEDWGVFVYGSNKGSGVSNKTNEPTNRNQPVLTIQYDVEYSGLSIRYNNKEQENDESFE